MSNETKVGLLAVVVIIISFIGYNFLKGVNLLNVPNLLYATYDNVATLSISSPIYIKGLQVGVVKNIYFKDDLQTIEVEMNIEKEFKIPKDAEAVITNTGLMGGTALYIKYNSVCSGDDCAKSGDRLKGRIASTLESYLGNPDELDPYFDKLRNNIGPLVDTIKNRVTDPNSNDAISKSIRDIAGILEQLKSATAGLNRTITANAQPISGIIKDAKSLTGNLEQNNDKITGILTNADSLSAQLASLELKNTMNQANNAIKSLENTMNNADNAIGQLTEILNKVNRGEGAIGKLLTDPSVIEDFQKAAVRLDSFLIDVEKHPYRYIPLKSRNKIKRYDAKDGRN